MELNKEWLELLKQAQHKLLEMSVSELKEFLDGPKQSSDEAYEEMLFEEDYEDFEFTRDEYFC